MQAPFINFAILISPFAFQKEIQHKPEPRCSFVEGARDAAVLLAMLNSGTKHGELVPVSKF